MGLRVSIRIQMCYGDILLWGVHVFDKWVANCNLQCQSCHSAGFAKRLAAKLFPVRAVQKNLDELLGWLE